MSAACCREGKTSWADLDLDEVDVRLKWAGLFHRRKRTPGRFMMRLKVGRAGGGWAGAAHVASLLKWSELSGWAGLACGGCWDTPACVPDGLLQRLNSTRCCNVLPRAPLSLRLPQVPNGEMTSEQLRFLGDCIAPYGADGCADITTRANIQARAAQRSVKRSTA